MLTEPISFTKRLAFMDKNVEVKVRVLVEEGAKIISQFCRPRGIFILCAAQRKAASMHSRCKLAVLKGLTTISTKKIALAN